MSKRTNTPLQLGQLFASNIFGKIVPNRERTATESHGKTTVENPSIYGNSSRDSRELFPQKLENYMPVKAVWPYITKDAFAQTMDNYRIYISEYNKKVKKLNSETIKNNNWVKIYKNEIELDDVQEKYISFFQERNAKLNPAEYNKEVLKSNIEHGHLLEMKNIATVKYASELVFKQLLHIYSTQLSKQTAVYTQLGTTEKKQIKSLEINAYHITKLKRNNIESIDVCIQTIRNHRERLEEAGVLLGYRFRGPLAGVKMHINSQILTVFDAKTQYLTSSENQLLTPRTSKEFVDSQRENKNYQRNIKKKENAVGSSQLNGTPSADFSFVFYKNIPEQGENSPPEAAAENVKVLTKTEKLTERLTAQIMSEQELAVKLSAGAFNSYTPIPMSELHHESNYGTMTREEFKELVVQDLFKSAAKLYRNTTPYIGSWKKAINSWMEKQFTYNNGNEVGLYHKSLMADKAQEFRWRINHAHKWFLKSKVKTLYPSDYFDFTRSEKKEIGFEYTKKAWQNHLKYIKDKPEKAKKVIKNAEARKVDINHAKKYENQLNRFIKNRISLEDLFDYVTNNLPSNYIGKLSETLLKLSASKVRYSIFDAPEAEC